MKYLILGAGPAGLALGNRLKEKGIDSFLILEKEKEPGGLCRTIDLDGAPFDIGGPHFLDTRSRQINEYLFRFMPEKEWKLFQRDSKIKLKDQMINSPIEANIWQMDIDHQLDYLESIALAGCNIGIPMPEKYVEWISWKLGEKIAGDYMIPYNSKLFADDLNTLGTYWMYKLPSVSFRETLRSCLEHKAYGKQPCVSKFYYPQKYGFGELWKRMGEEIAEHIVYSTSVTAIDFDSLTVKTESGETYSAENIITTIPWNEFSEIDKMPENLKMELKKLRYGAIETRYAEEDWNTTAQWIYCPEMKLPYHRLTIRKNIFSGAKGMIVETRKERVHLFDENDNMGKSIYMNEYAYPINTVDKPQIMEKIQRFAESKNVYTVGRWGEHKHHNSDVVVELAQNLIDKLLG